MSSSYTKTIIYIITGIIRISSTCNFHKLNELLNGFLNSIQIILVQKSVTSFSPLTF